jgi:hypothetical protein
VQLGLALRRRKCDRDADHVRPRHHTLNGGRGASAGPPSALNSSASYRPSGASKKSLGDLMPISKTSGRAARTRLS